MDKDFKSLMFLKSLKELIFFLKNVWGTFQFPKETYVRMAKEKRYWQMVLIFLLVFFSLMWEMAVKHGVFRNPMFFAVNLFGLFGVILGSFGILGSLLYFLGKSVGKTGELKVTLLLWSFTYIPTIIWFSIISFLFYIFPPPRSQTAQGYLLSGLIIVFSIALFYWKLLLYYLTLRVGFKLRLRQIIIVSGLFFPVAAGYSYMLYRAGVFKVPFI